MGWLSLGPAARPAHGVATELDLSALAPYCPGLEGLHNLFVCQKCGIEDAVFGPMVPE